MRDDRTRRYTLRQAADLTGETYWRLDAMIRDGWLDFTWRGKIRMVTIQAIDEAIRRETDATNNRRRQDAIPPRREMTFADTGFQRRQQ